MESCNKGFLVILEGGEGAGKSTLIKYFQEFLDPFCPLTVLREPGGTPFAESVRELFFNNPQLSPQTSVHLMNAQRQNNIENIIYPAINQGHIVLADRFTASTLIYQGLLKNQFDEVKELMIDMPKITIFVDVPPEIGLQRIADNKRETNHFDEMDITKHQIIYDGYCSLGNALPDDYWDIWIDGTKPLKELKQIVQSISADLQKHVSSGADLGHIKQQLRNVYGQKESSEYTLNTPYIKRYPTFNPKHDGMVHIKSLNIPLLMAHALFRIDVLTINQLMELTESEVLALKGVSPSDVEILERRFNKQFHRNVIAPSNVVELFDENHPEWTNDQIKAINKSVKDLDMSTRVHNIFVLYHIRSIYELLSTPNKIVASYRGMGAASKDVIKKALIKWSSLHDMDISGMPYTLDK